MASKNTEPKKESTTDKYGSTILGFIVVLVLGIFLFNVFRGNSADQDGSGDIADGGDQAEEVLPDGSKRYVVKAGDTLWSIAVDQYGDGYSWSEIVAANNFENPDSVEEGTEIILPKIAAAALAGTAMQQVAGAADQTEEAQPEQMVQAEEEAQPELIMEKAPETGELPADVTVQPGDTLWSIANIVYGDGHQWSNIAEANGLINPNVIHPGNLLTIPPAR